MGFRDGPQTTHGFSLVSLIPIKFDLLGEYRRSLRESNWVISCYFEDPRSCLRLETYGTNKREGGESVLASIARVSEASELIPL